MFSNLNKVNTTALLIRQVSRAHSLCHSERGKRGDEVGTVMHGNTAARQLGLLIVSCKDVVVAGAGL